MAKEEVEAVSIIHWHMEDLAADIVADEPEVIAENSDQRIRDTKEAVEFLDCFLSGGEKRKYGFDDDEALMGTFLCGDDYVAAMNAGVLTLRVGRPDDEERRVSFTSDCPRARAAWARIFRNREGFKSKLVRRR